MMSKVRLPKDSFRQKISRNSLTSEMTNFDNCFDNCCQREVKEMSKIRSTCQRFSLTTSNVKIFLQGLNFFHWMCPDFFVRWKYYKIIQTTSHTAPTNPTQPHHQQIHTTTHHPPTPPTQPHNPPNDTTHPPFCKSFGGI